MKTKPKNISARAGTHTKRRKFYKGKPGSLCSIHVLPFPEQLAQKKRDFKFTLWIEQEKKEVPTEQSTNYTTWKMAFWMQNMLVSY